MIYFAFVIPILLCLFYKLKFQRDITFAEFFLALAFIAVVVGLMVGAYMGTKGGDQKIISGYVVGKQYIPAHTETRTGVSCSGSGKSSSCHTYTYTVYISDDYTMYIAQHSPTDFEKRGASYGGEAYGETNFFGRDISKEYYYDLNLGRPAVWTTYFYNPLKLNKTTLYRIMNDEKYPQLDTPQIYNYIDTDRITLLNGLSLSKDWHNELNALNSHLLGYNINIGIIATTYDNNFATYLQTSWHGGNPNDFVVVIQVNSQKEIVGCKIVGWENQYLRVTVQDDILNNVKSLEDMDKIFALIEKDIRRIGFVEKDLSKFDYIRVELPIDYIIVVFFLSIVSTIFILEGVRTNGC